MEKAPKYFIVDSSALPEIFRKVAEAKRMLETGETDKVNVATKAVGISRSAFYKYRDCISPFQNMMAGRIITFQMVLKDKAGVLSSILSIFANCGANILTINQSIPTRAAEKKRGKPRACGLRRAQCKEKRSSGPGAGASWRRGRFV